MPVIMNCVVHQLNFVSLSSQSKNVCLLTTHECTACQCDITMWSMQNVVIISTSVNKQYVHNHHKNTI